MIRLSEVQDLLDASLAILGHGAGRVEMSDGPRRVRVGRLHGLPTESSVLAPEEAPSLPFSAAEVLVRAPALGVVSFRDNRTGRPFVEVGQRIEAGRTVAFITALDITTKVTSTAAGVVEEVFVEDGDGVEFNAPLLKILPEG